MNTLYNPLFVSKMLKSYIFDINRLKNLNEEELRKFQDKKIRKIVKFAYTVPLYHNKYKNDDIRPRDISGINDIKKLPVITKEDIRNYYPKGIISPKINKNNLIEISTSGTTGKTLPLYCDMLDMILWFFWYIRILREYNISWRKNKLTIIGDFANHTIGSGFVYRGLLANIPNNLFFKNIQWLNTNDKPEDIVKEINTFKPDFIGGYVGMLGHLALLKEKGYGKNINPKYIATIGSVLTNPLRNLLENIFDANVFEVYGATESGTIAFQCKKGSYHIMSDLVYPEFLKEGETVKSKEPGKMIITKLYGLGTPIIRYSAVNDIVAPLYEKCDCGISGLLIDRIYGRDDLALFFSNGRALLPSSISDIHGRILYELKTNKVKHTRIIQKDLKNLEIQLVIDKKLDKDKVSPEEIFSILVDGYHEKVGKDVNIDVKQVKKINRNEPHIQTKIDKSSFKIIKYV